MLPHRRDDTWYALRETEGRYWRSIRPGVYTITFKGVTFEDTASSEWCYRVDVEGRPALSFWILELCLDPVPTVLRVTLDGEELEEEREYQVVSDPITELFGIKFQIELSDGESGLFCVTLEGVFEEEPVEVAVKAGPTWVAGTICGPSCRPFRPVVRIPRGYANPWRRLG